MNKIIVSLVMLTSISSVYASLDVNVRYGQSGTQVSELQDFLNDKGLLTVSPTGFFGLLTLKAVKAYQTSVEVPNTGYVGVLTREKINGELAEDTASSTQAEVAETGTTTVVTVQNPVAPQVVYVPQYMYVPTYVPPQVQQPSPVVVIPPPTCSIVMERVTSSLGYPEASTTFSSTNATTRYLYQTYGGSEYKSIATGSVINGTNEFIIPMALRADYVGPGGTTTCEASLD